MAHPEKGMDKIFVKIDPNLKVELHERIALDGRSLHGWLTWITRIYLASKPGELEQIQNRTMETESNNP